MRAVLLSFIATLFTWGVTAFGALSVFLFKKTNDKILSIVLGFSSGVMVAASFWSLLNPAIELSMNLGYIIWLMPALGFLLGGAFVIISDLFLDKILNNKNDFGSKKRSILMVGAITMHNIPEGLAIGVAFGSAILGVGGMTLMSACFLTLGIGIQNFPEGVGVALPLRGEGCSKKKSFFYGQASGIVEPVFGVLGALVVGIARSLLPFLLSFAAGCMISVVARELIPESSKNSKNYASIGLILGFIIMMILDVSLSF